MIRKIFERLTYANVMATAAVFIALGATAYALGRNSVKSKHIAAGAVKASDTNDKLRLKCPGGTRFVEGACIEREARGSASFTTAEEQCLDDGRRLPSIAEGVALVYEPGLAIEEPGEWTLDRYQNTLNTGTTLQLATIVDATPAGQIASQTAATAMSYRCVAPARR